LAPRLAGRSSVAPRTDLIDGGEPGGGVGEAGAQRQRLEDLEVGPQAEELLA
jgi:hypothetical protein